MERSNGILLAISSLPSPHGIGTLGESAYAFVDFLHAAHQRHWQLLPLEPTSYGDSPYQSFSTFAGNPYYIDLDMLCEDGLLTRGEIEAVDWGSDPRRVDYGKIYASRLAVLEKAFARGYARDQAALEAFTNENAHWLSDYALFMALKRHFGMRAWSEWEDADIRMKRPHALARYRAMLQTDIQLFTYIQYLFFQQWKALRAYAKSKDVSLIGDMPIYVAMDSADVWGNPHLFRLDERNMPIAVSGVPPDYFSATGQLWGNPLYRWDRMQEDGYAWWIARVQGAARLYDVIRIDHFRGLESYWAVPYGAKDAIHGVWEKGPGMDLVQKLKERLPHIEMIAEDLGYLTPEVRTLLRESGFPGMKVLQFAFDSREPSDYLPHTYTPHCVCYVGTHDNVTVSGWEREADPADVEYARRYLGLNQEEGFNWGMIRGGMSSVAALFIAQMQDYLGLGADCRMNIPGTIGGNWRWRLLPGECTGALAKKIAAMTRMYGRQAHKQD